MSKDSPVVFPSPGTWVYIENEAVFGGKSLHTIG